MQHDRRNDGKAEGGHERPDAANIVHRRPAEFFETIQRAVCEADPESLIRDDKPY